MKLTYCAVFYPCEDGSYTAEVPDLKGCVSGGDTLAEAIDMITDAANGWVLDELEDGKRAPKASSYEEIKDKYNNELVKEITVNYPLKLSSLFENYKGETKQEEYWKDVIPVGKEEI